jgi:hypothetical protein
VRRHRQGEGSITLGCLVPKDGLNVDFGLGSFRAT